MAAKILNIDKIVSDPQVRGGRPVVVGTGIRVADIVLAHLAGDKSTPKQIAEHYRLGLGEVYAALAYYHLHQTEIDAQIQADADEAGQLLDVLEQQGKLRRLD